MEALLSNVRYAVRVLARTPGFTLVVVLTLALGIGANSVVFSAMDAILWQPLGFPDADRLVVVNQSIPNAPISNTAPVRIEEWNAESTTFAAITGYYREDVSETSGDLPEKFRLAHVAPRFLDVWRTEPLIGRAFTPADSVAGAAPVALVSHRYWTRKLESDPNVLERTVRIGEQAIPIVGVMPESFRFPDRDVDLFTPTIYEPFVLNRNNLWMRGYGRLEPGVSVEQARADLEVVQRRLAEQYPETDRNVGVYVEALKETTIGSVRGSLWLLFGAVSVLLLIASTNIAALLLARAAKRSQEISMRLSLGAPPASIRSLILVETAVLAVAGALLGLLVAVGASAALRRLAPDFPRIDELSLDGGILLYTLAAIVAVTVACGSVPAIRAARVGLSGALSDARRTQVSGRHSLQWLFVGIQVALSVVLLAGAGLLIRSFQELSRVDPGFEASRILTFRIGGTFDDFAQLAPRVELILNELETLPGVEATAVSSPVPGMIDDGSGFQFGIAELRVDGRDDTQEPARAQIRVVSPSYFETMQIPLVAGELCRVIPLNTPGTPVEVMVNSAFATRYFAGLVGRRRDRPAQPQRCAANRGRGRERARVRARSGGRALVLSVPYRVRDAGARVPRARARRPGRHRQRGSRQDQGARAAARRLRRRAAPGAHRQRVRRRSAADVGARVVRGHGARARVPRRLRHAELCRQLAPARGRSTCRARRAAAQHRRAVRRESVARRGYRVRRRHRCVAGVCAFHFRNAIRRIARRPVDDRRSRRARRRRRGVGRAVARVARRSRRADARIERGVTG